MPTFTVPDLPAKAAKYPPLEYMAYFEFRRVGPDGTKISVVRLTMVENLLTRKNIAYTQTPPKQGNWKTYIYTDKATMVTALKQWTQELSKRGYFLVTESPVMVPMSASDMRAVRENYMPRWAPDWAAACVESAEKTLAGSDGKVTAADLKGKPWDILGPTLPKDGANIDDVIKSWADEDEDEEREDLGSSSVAAD